MIKRKSNIELLRIVSMFMIVIHHMAAHGVQHMLDSDRYYLWMNGNPINKWFTALLIPIGHIAVAVFFIITGFFQVNTSSINWKKMLKLILEASFYAILSIIIFAVARLSGYEFEEITSGIFTFLGRAVFIPATGGIWWFLSAYLYLMILSPVINSVINKLNRRGMLFLLLFSWITIYSAAGMFSGIFFSIQRGVFFYLVGAFIRKEVSIERIKAAKWFLISGFVLCWSIDTLLWYFNSVNELQGENGRMEQLFSIIRSGLINSVFVVSGSIILFLLFLCIEFRSDFINNIASSTFGVYLLHENLITRSLIWRGILRIDTLQYQSVFFPVISFFSVIAVFSVCVFIDKLRGRYVEPLQYRIVDKCLDSIKNKWLCSF